MNERWFRAVAALLTTVLAACGPGLIVSGDGGGTDASDARHDTRTDAVTDAAPVVCDAMCPLHASCAMLFGRAQCVCDPSFHIGTGGCVPDGDPCTGVTCSGHGTCMASGGVATCVCAAGYHTMGSACVLDTTNPCMGVSCSGHGTCSVVGGVPQCACIPGYHTVGADCVMDMPDPCAGVTCSGHGTCVAAGSTATCRCGPGYHSTGLDCAADVTADPCAGVTCSGHGTCSNFGGVAVCTCAAGYYVSGLNCIATGGTDPCAGVTCDGHGHCLSDRGTSECHCDPGFVHTGLNLRSCQPATGTVCDGISCGPGGTCNVDITALGLSAACACDPGYVPYGTACIVERLIYCRDTGDMRVPRGTSRCGADDSVIESCYDYNGDGLLEWGVGGTCNAGTTCSTGCRTADCTVQACPMGSTCLPETHMIHVGVCVSSCDCTNCSNCTLAAFGASGAIQAYCNNPAGAPALGACHMPCPNAGDGCIPYGTGSDPAHPDIGNLCYPIEGCFSGPPL